jgi:1-deoxy-D-xylulose-5-phosphate reductoisomerase
MVEYVDGSILAQLGNPDMRTPIAHALGWPERIASGVESLDLVAAARLEFEAPDLARFPALRLAREAAESGGTAPAALNAANEVAVAAFLEGRLDFLGIPAVIERVVAGQGSAPARELGDVLEADAQARSRARAQLTGARQGRSG